MEVKSSWTISVPVQQEDRRFKDISQSQYRLMGNMFCLSRFQLLVVLEHVVVASGSAVVPFLLLLATVDRMGNLIWSMSLVPADVASPHVPEISVLCRFRITQCPCPVVCLSPHLGDRPCNYVVHC